MIDSLAHIKKDFMLFDLYARQNRVQCLTFEVGQCSQQEIAIGWQNIAPGFAGGSTLGLSATDA
jgi:hypothetical protein